MEANIVAKFRKNKTEKSQHIYPISNDKCAKKTASFDPPVKKDRHGNYKIKPEDGMVMTCFTSDFIHSAADEWRPEAWQMMKTFSDLQFYFITKRPERFYEGLPENWRDSYDNVYI